MLRKLLFLSILLGIFDFCYPFKTNTLVFRSDKTVQINGIKFSQIICTSSLNLCAKITEITCLQRNGDIVHKSCSITGSGNSVFYGYHFESEKVVCKNRKLMKANCYIKINLFKDKFSKIWFNKSPISDEFDEEMRRSQKIFLIFMAIFLMTPFISCCCLCCCSLFWSKLNQQTQTNIVIHEHSFSTDSTQRQNEINRPGVVGFHGNTVQLPLANHSMQTKNMNSTNDLNDQPPAYSTLFFDSKQNPQINLAYAEEPISPNDNFSSQDYIDQGNLTPENNTVNSHSKQIISFASKKI